ncbi:unnamed protein product [Caretta caretta]
MCPFTVFTGPAPVDTKVQAGNMVLTGSVICHEHPVGFVQGPKSLLLGVMEPVLIRGIHSRTVLDRTGRNKEERQISVDHWHMFFRPLVAYVTQYCQS